MKNRESITAVIRLFMIVLSLFVVASQAEETDLNAVSSEWTAALQESTTRGSNATTAQRLEKAVQALREWKAKQGMTFMPANQQQEDLFHLLDFRLAQAWVNSRDHEKALTYLQREVFSHVESNSRFLDNTRNPAAFAQDVFVLHSEIMARTGAVSSIPGAGYEVFDVSSKGGPPSFAFVHEPVESDEGGVAIEGVAEDEQRQVIELISPDESGRYKITDRAQVIGKQDGVSVVGQSTDGKPTLLLNGVSKFIEYKGDFGVPIVRQSSANSFQLAIDGGKIEQPGNAVKGKKPNAIPQTEKKQRSQVPAVQSNSPSSVQPAAPTKPNEQRPEPSTPAALPPLPTRWPVVAVAIVAVLGLLWLLLKMRK